MSLEKFEEKWFSMHNKVGDLQASGFENRRVVCLFICYDPFTISTEQLK